MKKYIKSANLGPYKYRYSVKATTPEGRQYLLGASKDVDGASDIAMHQADEIFDNPWMDESEKFQRLESIVIVDDDTKTDVTPADVEDYIDALMSEINSRR